MILPMCAADGSLFPVQNLPYGVFSDGGPARVGVAIGEQVLDLAPVLGDQTLAAPSLNPFMARGPAAWRDTRREITRLLTDPAGRAAVEPHLIPAGSVRLHLPFEVADYVDFYASEQHASNVGRIFRPGAEPLHPNWHHLPVGYHGRAGTVVVSGTPVIRPYGQRKRPTDPAPSYGPSRQLDIEAEVGFVVGAGSAPGVPVRPDEFAAHVFGVVLVNDWSARDIQALGVRAARPVPGQVVRHLDLPVGDPAGGAAGRPRPAAPRIRPLPYLRGREPWASTWPSRCRGTVIWWPRRRSARCTGRPPRCSRTSPPAARRCAPATCSPPAPCPGPRASSAARSWS